jgi:hypothetical protein
MSLAPRSATDLHLDAIIEDAPGTDFDRRDAQEAVWTPEAP